MSRPETLDKLESMLESFLDRAAKIKSEETKVSGGIDSLEDIALGFLDGDDQIDELGNWFARHAEWKNPTAITHDERRQVTEILREIRRELRINEESSPAVAKIAGEIDRWEKTARQGGHKVVLKRGPEIAPPPGSVAERLGSVAERLGSVAERPGSVAKRPGFMPPSQGSVIEPSGMNAPQSGGKGAQSNPVVPPFEDSIALFRKQIDRLTGRFADSAEHRLHILSVLDDCLKSAELQESKDALILSALIIYYLKQSGYLVLPYVERLREAERLQKGVRSGE